MFCMKKFVFRPLAIIGLVTLLSLAACAEHAGTTAAAVCENDARKRELYERHVVGALGACVRCHGTSQAPLFLSQDRAVAYAAVATRLSGNPSILETRAGNNHCGPDCGNAAPVVAAMNNYRVALGGTCSESSGEFAFRSTTGALTTVPMDGNEGNVSLSFPQAPGAIGQLQLILVIRRVLENNTPTGRCIIRRINYRSPGGNVRVDGVQLWPDENVDHGLRNYLALVGAARITAPNAAAPLLFGVPQHLPCPTSIAVAINAQQVESFPSTGVNPVARAFFLENVRPILRANCISCHRRGDTVNNRYSFTDNQGVELGDDAFYNRALERAQITFPETSPLLRRPVDMPNQPVLPHGGGKTKPNSTDPHLTAAEIAVILNWLNQENTPF
jgi:cytochrome c553